MYENRTTFVVRRNLGLKSWLSNVLHLLKCSCASESQMAMLYASIIVRILFWHQLAAGVKTSTSLPLPSWDGPASMDPFATTGTTASRSHRSSCSTSTISVASEPITIGTYVPNQEGQEPMRQLFWLIEMFAQVEDPVDVGSRNIRSMLVSSLNSELTQTIKVVGKGMKTAIGQQS